MVVVKWDGWREGGRGGKEGYNADHGSDQWHEPAQQQLDVPDVRNELNATRARIVDMQNTKQMSQQHILQLQQQQQQPRQQVAVVAANQNLSPL